MTVTEYELGAIDAGLAREVTKIQEWVARAVPLGDSPTLRLVVVPEQNVYLQTSRLEDGGYEIRLSTYWFDQFKGEFGRKFSQSVAHALLRQALRVRLSQLDTSESSKLRAQITEVFGPSFNEGDIHEATTSKKYRGSGRNRSPVPNSSDKIDSIIDSIGAQLRVTSRDGFAYVLMAAWDMHLGQTWRPHLAREFGTILDAAYFCEFPDLVDSLQARAAGEAREALQQLLSGTYPVPAGAERAHAPRRNALTRMKELSGDPSLIRDGEVDESATIDDKKIELFEILQLLSNVVNTDVHRFLEEGGVLDDDFRKSWPFQAETSSLGSDRWIEATKRAAALIKALPSDQHRSAIAGDASDINIVLYDIGQGYSAIVGEDKTIKAAEYRILMANPFVSPAELREIIGSSKSLGVHQAGGNVLTLNAGRYALSLAPADEGSYAPASTERVHPDNLVFDQDRGQVRFRKPLSQFAVPKSVRHYRMAVNDLGPVEQEPTIGDIVVDDMGAAVTLACPGLTPLDKAEAAPLPDNWLQRVDHMYQTRWLEYFPSRTFSQIPDDLRAVVKPNKEVRGIEVRDIRGVRVVVRRTNGFMSISGDDAALAGVQFERDDSGVLRIIGSGPTGNEAAENPDDWPVLEVRLLGGQSTFDFDCSGVDHLSVFGPGTARISVPSGGYAFVGADTTELDLAPGASVVAAPTNSYTGPTVNVSTHDRDAGNEPPTLTVFGNGYRTPVITGDEGVVAQYFERSRMNGNHPVWEVSADELPAEIISQVRRGPEWILGDVLELPDSVGALRNRLRTRTMRLRERLHPDNETFDSMGNRCVSAITREALANAPFLAGLIAASENEGISTSSQRVFQAMVRVVTSDSKDDQQRRETLLSQDKVRGFTWRSPLARTSPEWRPRIDEVFKQISDATDLNDLNETAVLIEQLEMQVDHDLPVRAVNVFFEELGAVATEDFDVLPAMASLLNESELAKVASLLNVPEPQTPPIMERGSVAARGSEMALT